MITKYERLFFITQLEYFGLVLIKVSRDLSAYDARYKNKHTLISEACLKLSNMSRKGQETRAYLGDPHHE